MLVREEIELAKAEIVEKASKLAKGTLVGVTAGVFVLIALLFVLEGLAWLAWFEIAGNTTHYYIGFFTVAGALLLLATLAGFIAYRAVRAGSPPTPDLAIDEARKIAETVSSSPEPVASSEDKA